MTLKAPEYPTHLAACAAAIRDSQEPRTVRVQQARDLYRVMADADAKADEWAHSLMWSKAGEAARAGWLDRTVYWLARALWQEIATVYGRVELRAKFAWWELRIRFGWDRTL